MGNGSNQVNQGTPQNELKNYVGKYTHKQFTAFAKSFWRFSQDVEKLAAVPEASQWVKDFAAYMKEESELLQGAEEDFRNNKLSDSQTTFADRRAGLEAVEQYFNNMQERYTQWVNSHGKNPDPKMSLQDVNEKIKTQMVNVGEEKENLDIGQEQYQWEQQCSGVDKLLISDYKVKSIQKLSTAFAEKLNDYICMCVPFEGVTNEQENALKALSQSLDKYCKAVAKPTEIGIETKKMAEKTFTYMKNVSDAGVKLSTDIEKVLKSGLPSQFRNTVIGFAKAVDLTKSMYLDVNDFIADRNKLVDLLGKSASNKLNMSLNRNNLPDPEPDIAGASEDSTPEAGVSEDGASKDSTPKYKVPEQERMLAKSIITLRNLKYNANNFDGLRNVVKELDEIDTQLRKIQEQYAFLVTDDQLYASNAVFEPRNSSFHDISSLKKTQEEIEKERKEKGKGKEEKKDNKSDKKEMVLELREAEGRREFATQARTRAQDLMEWQYYIGVLIDAIGVALDKLPQDDDKYTDVRTKMSQKGEKLRLHYNRIANDMGVFRKSGLRLRDKEGREIPESKMIKAATEIDFNTQIDKAVEVQKKKDDEIRKILEAQQEKERLANEQKQREEQERQERIQREKQEKEEENLRIARERNAREKKKQEETIQQQREKEAARKKEEADERARKKRENSEKKKKEKLDDLCEKADKFLNGNYTGYKNKYDAPENQDYRREYGTLQYTQDTENSLRKALTSLEKGLPKDDPIAAAILTHINNIRYYSAYRQMTPRGFVKSGQKKGTTSLTVGSVVTDELKKREDYYASIHQETAEIEKQLGQMISTQDRIERVEFFAEMAGLIESYRQIAVTDALLIQSNFGELGISNPVFADEKAVKADLSQNEAAEKRANELEKQVNDILSGELTRYTAQTDEQLHQVLSGIQETLATDLSEGAKKLKKLVDKIAYDKINTFKPVDDRPVTEEERNELRQVDAMTEEASERRGDILERMRPREKRVTEQLENRRRYLSNVMGVTEIAGQMEQIIASSTDPEVIQALAGYGKQLKTLGETAAADGKMLARRVEKDSAPFDKQVTADFDAISVRRSEELSRQLQKQPEKDVQDIISGAPGVMKFGTEQVAKLTDTVKRLQEVMTDAINKGKLELSGENQEKITAALSTVRDFKLPESGFKPFQQGGDATAQMEQRQNYLNDVILNTCAPLIDAMREILPNIRNTDTLDNVQNYVENLAFLGGAAAQDVGTLQQKGNITPAMTAEVAATGLQEITELDSVRGFEITSGKTKLRFNRDEEAEFGVLLENVGGYLKGAAQRDTTGQVSARLEKITKILDEAGQNDPEGSAHTVFRYFHADQNYVQFDLNQRDLFLRTVEKAQDALLELEALKPVLNDYRFEQFINTLHGLTNAAAEDRKIFKNIGLYVQEEGNYLEKLRQQGQKAREEIFKFDGVITWRGFKELSVNDLRERMNNVIEILAAVPGIETQKQHISENIQAVTKALDKGYTAITKDAGVNQIKQELGQHLTYLNSLGNVGDIVDTLEELQKVVKDEATVRKLAKVSSLLWKDYNNIVADAKQINNIGIGEKTPLQGKKKDPGERKKAIDSATEQAARSIAGNSKNRSFGAQLLAANNLFAQNQLARLMAVDVDDFDDDDEEEDAEPEKDAKKPTVGRDFSKPEMQDALAAAILYAVRQGQYDTNPDKKEYVDSLNEQNVYDSPYFDANAIQSDLENLKSNQVLMDEIAKSLQDVSAEQIVYNGQKVLTEAIDKAVKKMVYPTQENKQVSAQAGKPNEPQKNTGSAGEPHNGEKKQQASHGSNANAKKNTVISHGK